MKKKINILLIIAVLLLWGSVIYKSLSNYLFADKNLSAASKNYTANQFKIIEKDTFKLENLTRDPFLNKSSVIKKDKPTGKSYAAPKKATEKKSIPATAATAPFPSVSYYGYIKSKEKKDELIIIKINNKLKKVRINETFEGLKIKKIFKDSIYISNNSETKTFFKS